ncbi:hypothetical protein [Streptomyces sp. SID8014]|uniref:hypothetical protein n=1 Tax=Streptomyces sp. SID8014 TaxID=2706097 RepID=UPI001EF38F1E|nr:hypothetical protein [Streptomyces sp. SID8014]
MRLIVASGQILGGVLQEYHVADLPGLQEPEACPLIASGHTPASAEGWAARTLAWAAAPGPGITAFAAASHRLWTEISTSDPDPWTTRLEAAARVWDEYRTRA